MQEPTLTANRMRDHLRKGRETYARREWHDAYHVFLCADEATPLEADDLERLATAAYLIGRELEFQRVIERLRVPPLRPAGREVTTASSCLAMTFPWTAARTTL